MFHIRPLLVEDIPRLTEINPTFTAKTTIRVEQVGAAPFTGWALTEIPLKRHFHKKHGYDFDPHEQQAIEERLTSKTPHLIEVVENPHTGRLVGIVDVTEEAWRNTAWIWNLMLDVEVRGQGLGRQLMQRVFQWSTQRQHRAILLETQSNNTPACHFYARMGFRCIGINEIFYTNRDIDKGEVAIFWGYTL